LGAGVEAATGAATGAAATVFGAISFLAAGILFDLETEEEDDIFNAVVYSYHRRSSKPFYRVRANIQNIFVLRRSIEPLQCPLNTLYSFEFA